MGKIMSNIHFSETILSSQSKTGVLKPDSSGYYSMVIGGLNVFNSVGQYYVHEGAKDLFNESSLFTRRIKSGNLKGEVGHPKKLPGMTMDDYIQRIMSIEETNVCVHFSDIWLDVNFGKNNPKHKNPDLVAIWGKLKPSGPKGQALLESLNNPSENVCFSIRALTKDRFTNGRTERQLVQIVSWDWVIEPGISIANKWTTPTLESRQDIIIPKGNLVKIATESITSSFIASETSSEIFKETLNIFNVTEQDTPNYLKW